MTHPDTLLRMALACWMNDRTSHGPTDELRAWIAARLTATDAFNPGERQDLQRAVRLWCTVTMPQARLGVLLTNHWKEEPRA